MGTKIEWTDKTWNPIVGCSHVSAGCDGCYAAREADGRLSSTPTYAGLTVRPDGEPPRFTGEIRLLPERLDKPLRWRDPRLIFVNSMSDLFHPDVPDAFIADVFAVMALAHYHQFQVLTKRPQRMAALLSTPEFEHAVYAAIDARVKAAEARRPRPNHRIRALSLSAPAVWPFPNVWLGTSVEDQRYANIRIPHLLRVPAAVRFLSVEPLLGPVDIGPWIGEGPDAPCSIGWVIVGGESGPRARPMHPSWARDLRDQCEAAGVPFLFKQWGEWAPFPHPAFGGGRVWPVTETETPVVCRVGKKAAGRELDGRTWDGYPA